MTLMFASSKMVMHLPVKEAISRFESGGASQSLFSVRREAASGVGRDFFDKGLWVLGSSSSLSLAAEVAQMVEQ